MLSGRLQARDCTLCGAHTAGNRFLGKAGARASGQHFMSKRVFDIKGFIGLAKADLPPASRTNLK